MFLHDDKTFFAVLYLKPRIVPNLPIGIDEHSEVDMEWKGVSFHNHDKSRGRSLYNHDTRNIKRENSMEEEQATRLMGSRYVCMFQFWNFHLIVYILPILKTHSRADIYMVIFCSSKENSTRPFSNATTYTDLSHTYSANETETMKATEQGSHSACKYHVIINFMSMYDDRV